MPSTGQNANPTTASINNLPNVIPTKFKASVVQAQLLSQWIDCKVVWASCTCWHTGTKISISLI